MSWRRVLPIAVLFLLVLGIVAGVLFFSPPQSDAGPQIVATPAELNASLNDLRESVISRSMEIQDALLVTADAISDIDRGDPELDVILRELYNKIPTSLGVCYVDREIGVGRSVPLGSLYSLISSKEFPELTESSFAGKPLLLIGPIYSLGYGEVIVFASPVHYQNGDYRGYLCTAIYPSDIIDEEQYPGSRYYTDSGYLFWIISAEGTIFYAPENDFIGMNLSGFPLYPSLQDRETMTLILNHPLGAIEYLSPTSKVLTAAWTTVTVDGRELRLLLAMPKGYDSIPILPINPRVDQVTAAAQSLYLYATENGKDTTLAELKKTQNTFPRFGTLYFAYTMNGTVLYDDLYPLKTGINRINSRDAYGLRPVSTEILRAHHGGGFVYSYQPVHLPDGDKALLYLSYVMPVDEEWFVGARMPIMSRLVDIDTEKRSVVLSTVNNMTSYVLIHGKDAALEEFNNPAGRFYSDNISVSALDYNGTVLADSLSPDWVGRDAFYYADAFGASSMREAVMQAKLGGGYMYFGVRDPVTDELLLILIYVLPMGDDWCIASGVLLDRISA